MAYYNEVKGAIMILVIILLFIIIINVVEGKLCKKSKITIYFGVPGSGKSTIACRIARKKLKKKIDVYSNFAIKGTYKLEKEDIGKYQIENSLLIFDEAGVDFDNRNWKVNFNKDQVYFLKNHRHYKDDIIFFSQNLDMDVKIRNLSDDLRIVKKSIIPFFVVERSIKKTIGINPDTKQLEDVYCYKFLSRKWYFMPKSWKYFNSYTRKELASKVFEKY